MPPPAASHRPRLVFPTRYRRVHPLARTVREDLTLPDLCRCLDLLQDPLAGLPGLAAVGGAHSDDHTVLSQGNNAYAMVDCHLLGSGEYAERALGNGVQRLLRPRFVAVVAQLSDGLAINTITRDSTERDNRAGVVVLDPAVQLTNVERISGDSCVCRHAETLPQARCERCEGPDKTA